MGYLGNVIWRVACNKFISYIFRRKEKLSKKGKDEVEKMNNCIAIQTNTRANSIKFTLIELLVVIAIISILMAMLLPALKTVKTIARAICCVNTTKQFYVASISYANDWQGASPCAWQAYMSGLLPGPGNPRNYNCHNSWAYKLHDGGYMSMGKYRMKEFTCPEVGITKGVDPNTTFYFSDNEWETWIVWCYEMAGQRSCPAGIKYGAFLYNDIFRIPTPSKAVMITDIGVSCGKTQPYIGEAFYIISGTNRYILIQPLGSHGAALGYAGPKTGIFGYHLGKNTYMMFDGHVESKSCMDAVDADYGYIRF